jgi:integrase
MPKGATIHKVHQEGPGRFRVRFPAGVRTAKRPDGTIVRRTIYRQRRFTSERAAREFATDLGREQRETGEKSYLVSDAAKRALVQLAPRARQRGETIEALLSDLGGALEALEALRDPVTGKAPRLLDAVQEYSRLVQPSLGSKPTMEEIDLYLEEVDKRAQAGIIQLDTARDVRNRISKFLGSKLAAQPLGYFGTKQGAAAIRKWLEAQPLSPVTFNNYRRHLSIFFGWAVRNEKLQRNPCDKIEERRKSRAEETEPGIISPAELRTLLLVARGEMPGVSKDDRWTQALAELVPGIVIQAFCGVRAKELTRLTWQDLDLPAGLITISKGKSKTRRGRLIPLPDAAADWLSPYLGRTGLIAPSQYERKLSTLRGIMRKPPNGSGSSPTFLPCEMPDNCLRHSFGTYHLALSKNEAETSRLMGNSPSILRAHYEAISKRALLAAPDWFTVRPVGVALQLGTERSSKRSGLA